MIARIWHGRTAAAHADEYLEYMKETGVKDIRAVEGNAAAYILRRVRGDVAEFRFVSLWESFDAIRKFAGEEMEKAVYYPEDRRYLLEMEPEVSHFEVAEAAEAARVAAAEA